MTPQTLDPALKQNILQALGFASMSAEDQERTLHVLGDIIFQKVMLKVVELLPAAEMDQLSAIMQSEDQTPGATLQFLKLHIPDFDAIVTAEVAEFKQDTLGVLEAARTQAEL